MIWRIIKLLTKNFSIFAKWQVLLKRLQRNLKILCSELWALETLVIISSTGITINGDGKKSHYLSVLGNVPVEIGSRLEKITTSSSVLSFLIFYHNKILAVGTGLGIHYCSTTCLLQYYTNITLLCNYIYITRGNCNTGSKIFDVKRNLFLQFCFSWGVVFGVVSDWAC